MNDLTDILLKEGLTLALGFLFGYVRQKLRKPIGFGTFIFVSVGACSLSIIALRLPAANTVPLLAAIVTGIGFLGAGALIKSGEKIHGFTSAALIWLFAIFGLTIGVGEFTVGIIIYTIVWVVSFADNFFQRRGIGAYTKQLRVVIESTFPDESLHSSPLQNHECLLTAVASDRLSSLHTFTYDIVLSGEDSAQLVTQLLGETGVRHVEVE
ncbi:MAG: hypothetical protein CO090_06315 [Acidobacteria bacterium CG_4_9_14_3_um_filter_49_7]|nr:MAG: hypothetical protein CO090_06315 [Acidobacteria bacterium CG_4_9_14_3_um_filter_49_7]